jgi:hypothetical protein
VRGACRSQEWVKLKFEDIEEIKLGLFVKIPHTKTKKPRSFTVNKIVKHLALRPKNFNERRLFIKTECVTDKYNPFTIVLNTQHAKIFFC